MLSPAAVVTYREMDSPHGTHGPRLVLVMSKAADAPYSMLEFKREELRESSGPATAWDYRLDTGKLSIANWR